MPFIEQVFTVVIIEAITVSVRRFLTSVRASLYLVDNGISVMVVQSLLDALVYRLGVQPHCVIQVRRFRFHLKVIFIHVLITVDLFS